MPTSAMVDTGPWSGTSVCGDDRDSGDGVGGRALELADAGTAVATGVQEAMEAAGTAFGGEDQIEGVGALRNGADGGG